ncbi:MULTISPECIES: acetyl-CoA acetyltransferase [unclassified Chelatococcus]|uniref:acetyl-CoA acetyltransferase n=1 Tax=unclassified Chelatococcus TaxID=2638111 RepID=UPI001BCC16BE|nr:MULTISPECIES: acetyl-CoA acetyltransferase [unclassified Chelatococcus]MBS7698552.1 thiolase [Chelatococcus sp. YT9]MBX3554797.1 thiolase [Chelatococcus sp.]
MSLKGTVAITGVGTFGTGASPGWSAPELMQAAALRAVGDAGLKLGDIDGLCASTFYHFFPTLTAAEMLGVHPRWSDADMAGGSSFMNHVMHAAAAIQAGLCNHVLILYGSNARSSRNLNGLAETPDTEAPFEPLVPLSGYALAASRYLHQYGATREDLGRVHLAAREWAALNPEAELRDPLSMDDYLSSRLIASPFCRYDCCLVSDGGAAIVVSRADRARDMRRKPVYLLGGGAAHWHREIAQMPDLTITAATESSSRAYAMAGLGPADIDVVELYDAFTLNVLLFLEDLGFARKGEASGLVASGAIAPGGGLPVNTNGGGLCCVHPGMYGLFCIIEAVTQLRGDGGERQVAGAETAIAHGNGGTLSHQATLILGGPSTL